MQIDVVFTCRLVWMSYLTHDVSPAADATPLWIPQIAMALGSLVLAIALVDALVLEWQGNRAHTVPEEALHHE